MDHAPSLPNVMAGHKVRFPDLWCLPFELHDGGVVEGPCGGSPEVGLYYLHDFASRFFC